MEFPPMVTLMGYDHQTGLHLVTRLVMSMDLLTVKMTAFLLTGLHLELPMVNHLGCHLGYRSDLRLG